MFDFLVGNNFLLSLISFALVLIPAVIVHELGHLFAAKSVGITILEFGIGFPPRIAKLFKWGETEFTLNWIPLGGFVMPLGEDFVKPLSEAETESERAKLETRLKNESPSGAERAQRQGVKRPKAVFEANPFARIWFFSAGALANFIGALVLFALVGMTGIPETIGARISVVYIAPESALAEAGLQAEDVIERLNGEPFLTPQAFFERLNTLDGQEAVLTIRRVDPDIDVSSTNDPYTVMPEQEIRFTVDTESQQALRSDYVRVMGIVEDAPAGRAGLRPGDLIVSFNGEEITTVDRLIAATNENVGREVTLEILNANGVDTIELTPRVNPPQGQGPIGISIQPASANAVAGIVYQEAAPQQILVPLSPLEAGSYALNRTGEAVSMIVSLPVQLLQGNISAEDARPVSVVGISAIGSQILSNSIEENQFGAFLTYIALINIALGVTNLLPLPALDGGRILFVLIEIVRGRPVKPEFESIVHMVGLALLLGVAVLVILNDIINPITLPQ